MTYRCIACLPLVILLGSCKPPDPRAPVAPPREAPDAIGATAPASPTADPGQAAAPTSPTPPAGLGAGLALGSPVVRTATELEAVRWIQDGGGQETLRPTEGSRFVVVSFPEASKVTYTSTEVVLAIDGQPPLSPHAVTSPTANPIQPRSADPGPARFQREVYMFLDWEPGPNTPFAIAFEVPAATQAGTLRMAGAEAPLAW